MQSATLFRRHRGPTLLVAVALPLVVCLIVGAVSTAAANDAALVLVIVVVAAAATGMRSVGLTAAVAGALSYDFFLTAPYLRFAILDRDDIETTVLLLLVGVGTTELALWGRRQQDRASQQSGYLRGVMETSATLSGTSVTPEVLRGVSDRLSQILGVDDVEYTDLMPRGTARLGVDGCVDRSGRPVDLQRDGLPTDDVVALPAGASGGAFLITSATAVRRISADQAQVAVTLADQVGSALTRDRARPR